MNSIESNKGEIVMYQPDETIRLEVRMGEDTVWLTQQQMADLFDKDRTVIGRHIRNIYKEEELERNITCAKFAHMGADGDQAYEFTAYNLDVIISVGYRVKSKRGTKFRQWAKTSIVLIDNYIDVDTLTMLSNRNANVSATIYTRQLSQQQQLDVQRHNQQYPPIVINVCQRNHDRFLIIDDVVYVFGASLKDAGKKLFAYIRMQETSAQELLNKIR